MSRPVAIAAVVVPVVVFLAVYGAHAGHGFIVDDYGWIVHSRVRSTADVAALFSGGNGFYRPVVALSFMVNEWMFGSHPLGYGLTNVLLALGSAVAIVYLARSCALSTGASVLAGLLWLMNFHFTKMAVLWISGRTALVVTAAAVLTAASVMRGRLIFALLFLAVAVFAKEEAVLLPIVLSLWLIVWRRQLGRAPVSIPAWIAGSIVIVGLYLVARSFTQAMTLATVPSYYTFTFEPMAVLKNIGEYADRTSTLALGVAVGALLTLGWHRVAKDMDARASDANDRRLSALILCGLAWLVVMLGFAYFLPVRSDLYAALPGVGICLAVAAVVERLWDASTPGRRQWALVGAIVLGLILAPVYWSRTSRLTTQADFSSTMLDDLERLLKPIPAKSRIVVYDVAPGGSDRAPTLEATLGGLINEAYELRTGRQMNLVLVTTRERPADGSIPIEATGFLPLVVQDGRLRFASPGAR